MAWVAVGHEYRAIGHLASSRFHGNPKLNSLRYEVAVYKTLAAFWAIKEKFKLPSKLRVALGVLLPPGEYSDRARFEDSLRQAAAKFTSPTGEMTVTLSAFDCKPEGGGTYLAFQEWQTEDFKQRTTSVVMVGYRNASVLSVSHGKPLLGKMSDLGFVRLLNDVLAKTSGQTMETLTPAMSPRDDRRYRCCW